MTETPDVVDGTVAGDEPEATGTALVVTNPATGEVIDLEAAATNELGYTVEEVDLLLDGLRAFRQDIVNATAKRLDKIGARKEVFGDVELETNAPRSDEYPVALMRVNLEGLVEDGHLDAAIVDRIIRRPARTVDVDKLLDELVAFGVIGPERHGQIVECIHALAGDPGEGRVMLTEVNKLKRSDDPAVLAALGRARVTKSNVRTLKVRRKEPAR